MENSGGFELPSRKCIKEQEMQVIFYISMIHTGIMRNDLYIYNILTRILYIFDVINKYHN